MTTKVYRYFDESIFTDCGFTLKPYDAISVTNRADAWLVGKLGKPIIKSFCTDVLATINENNLPTEKIANINPRVPCIGTNIYTLNNTALETLIIVPFFQITVMSRGSTATAAAAAGNSSIGDSSLLGKQPVQLSDDFDPSIVFTINEDLTNYEHAIMIKYYSKKSAIKIDHKLYNSIRKHLKTKGQVLFKFDDIFSEHKRRLAEYRLNLVNFEYTSPAITL